MATSVKWEILDGLPAYGPAAVAFSATGLGTHSEGLVIRVHSSSGAWVGNFQREASSVDRVLEYPDGRCLLVIAGGSAYVVDPETRELVRHFGGQIEQVLTLPEDPSFLFGNGLWFEALGREGMKWRSRRISWDGFRHVVLNGNLLCGEAYAPEGPEGAWYAFELDVQTGTVTGGSYYDPPI
jgi:hypothetical protein